jgi:hypothetical protein
VNSMHECKNKLTFAFPMTWGTHVRQGGEMAGFQCRVYGTK